MNFPGDRRPEGMNDTQGLVTLFDRPHDDPEGGDIVYVMELYPLTFHLLVDTGELFDPPGHLPLDAELRQFFGNDPLYLIHIALPLFLGLGHLLGELAIGLGFQVSKCQFLQFRLNPINTQAVGNGGKDLEGLLGDLLLLLGIEKVQGAHVVKPVGQLDEDHLDILHHRQDHLAEVLGLLLFTGLKAYLADLGHPIYQLGDLITKAFLDLLHRSQRVLDGIVEQAGNDARHIQLHLNQDPCHFERMDKIGFAGTAHLPLMNLGREDIGLLQKPEVCRGIVGLNLFCYVIESKHGDRRKPEARFERNCWICFEKLLDHSYIIFFAL